MGPVHNFLCKFYWTQGQISPISEYVDPDPNDHCHSEKVFLLRATIHYLSLLIPVFLWSKARQSFLPFIRLFIAGYCKDIWETEIQCYAKSLSKNLCSLKLSVVPSSLLIDNMADDHLTLESKISTQTIEADCIPLCR